MKVTPEFLSKMGDDVLSAMATSFEDTKLYEEDLAKFYRECDLKRIQYCLTTLIDSEFDCETRGKHGLGRVQDHPPRLGGHFRKQILKFEGHDIDKLKALVAELMVKPYLTMVAAIGRVESSRRFGSEELYEEWLPNVYLFNIHDLPPPLPNLLFDVVKNAYEELASIFQSEKTGDILSGYAAAGIVMYLSEKELSK